jgi:hypothetical protein
VKRPREVSDEEVELLHGSVGDSRFNGSSAGVHADGELATTGKPCVTTDGGLTLVERDRPTSNPVSPHAQEEACVIATEESAAHEPSGGAIDQVLRTLRCLSPKVMVVVEQESSHNGPTLLERFIEALHYYCAMFDSLDSTMPQQCLERVTLEKHLFGQEIKNIVACEGVERVERHEKLEKWRKRMENAGFQMLALSQPTVLQAKRLLHCYACDGYRLLEKDGCLTLCWQDTPLYSASAWHA